MAISYRTWDDDWKTHTWSGSLDDLVDDLVRIVEEYGSRDPYA